MSGRVTPPKDPDGELPSLRERNPTAFWVAILLVVAMVLATTGGFILTAIL
jgi:hypothetical protein